MTMRLLFICLIYFGLFAASVRGLSATISEIVYVQSPVDSDHDGRLDRIYVKIERPSKNVKLPSIFSISPYGSINSSAENHDVDLTRLPQDQAEQLSKNLELNRQILSNKNFTVQVTQDALTRGYASVTADSVGTGKSEGCPTVGDNSETLAGKAVIDWLNGHAQATYANGSPAKASWANGSVGMTGVSYNGTLPNMIATTGVQGLKAIVPIAAISNWYNYYRSNGLVVGPGGYIGEDADVLGIYVLRKGRCVKEIQEMAETMGREHGDYTSFWQTRNYLPKASATRAAVFIIHGQNDWNVKQRHAIEWWEALEGVVPRRMWLHKGGHGGAARPDANDQIWAWFDHYVKGVDNGVELRPVIEVQDFGGVWKPQSKWPHEATESKTLFLNPNLGLSESPSNSESNMNITDSGRVTKLSSLIVNPATPSGARVALLSDRLNSAQLLSGTSKLQLLLSVTNRRAANITAAIVDYDSAGKGTIVTRGWVDPQNHLNIEAGELLDKTKDYEIRFELEPKQFTFAEGHRIGVILASTDYEYTIRPVAGTEISFRLGKNSFIEMNLSEQ